MHSVCPSFASHPVRPGGAGATLSLLQDQDVLCDHGDVTLLFFGVWCIRHTPWDTAGALETLAQSLMGKRTAICKMAAQDDMEDGEWMGLGQTGLL